MKNSYYGPLFIFIRGLIRISHPKYSVQIPHHIDGPVAYISHHQNLFGPFVTMLWFPNFIRTWILDALLDQHTCYRQYVDYTFTKRFGINKYVAKIMALPLSYIISHLLQSGRGIPVYRGSRKILQTFKLSVAALCKGESIVIFPDIDYRDRSSQTKEMYDGFLFLERYYFQATGQHICFVPLYASKNKRMLIADKPIYFRNEAEFNAERNVVYQKIHDCLNLLAANCGDI